MDFSSSNYPVFRYHDIKQTKQKTMANWDWRDFSCNVRGKQSAACQNIMACTDNLLPTHSKNKKTLNIIKYTDVMRPHCQHAFYV